MEQIQNKLYKKKHIPTFSSATMDEMRCRNLKKDTVISGFFCDDRSIIGIIMTKLELELDCYTIAHVQQDGVNKNLTRQCMHCFIVVSVSLEDLLHESIAPQVSLVKEDVFFDAQDCSPSYIH